MMSNWQLTTPLGAVVFDCDGTLSQIEGINVLAEQNGVGDQVAELTEQAMSETGISADLYAARLALVKPAESQLVALADAYYQHISPGVETVFEILQALGKTVYVASAGVNPSVSLFSEKLGIPAKHVFAVDIEFDDDGNYRDYDHLAPTSLHQGKRHIIETIKGEYQHVMHVGDGMNDMAVRDMVTRFIGYGGVYVREKFAKLCDFYLRTPSFLAMLPLMLTLEEVSQLSEDHQVFYMEGLNLLEEVL